jgi:autotransporter-associated beta strand protein
MTLAGARQSMGVNGTWTGGGGDGLWSNSTNWTALPGLANGTFTSPDIAIFDSSSPTATVAVDANRNVAGLTYDSSAAANYVIGAEGVNAGPALHLTGGGLTQVTAGVAPAAAQSLTINSPVLLRGNAYTFAHNSASVNASLVFRGNISSSASGLTTLTLDGTHVNGTQSNAEIRGSITDGASGTTGLVKSGTGIWELIANSTTTPNTYSGDTVVNGGILRIVNDALETNDGAGGLSPNSNYIVNSGGTLQVRVLGNTARSITVNTGGALAVTTANTTVVSLKNNNGVALTLNYATLVGDAAVSLPISLTGTTALQGGVKYIGNASAGIVGIGATGSPFDLGTVMRQFDIGEGQASNTYDLRTRGPVNGGAPNGGILKTGLGTFRFDNANNTFTGTLEVREGEVRVNANNGLTGLPKLLVSGGTFNVLGGQTQTLGPVTINKGTILGSNSTSLVLAPSYALAVATGDTATISTALGNAPSTTATLTKTGPGSAILTNPLTYTGDTVVNGGVLQLNENAHAGILGSETQAASTIADVRSGRLVFDYNINTSRAATIVPLLQAAYPGDFSTGPIRSSTSSDIRGLGYFDDTVAHQFIVASTLYGDANLDATVGFPDLVALAQNYNLLNVTWSQGDSNYDFKVDFADLVTLAQNYGKSVTTDGSIIVNGAMAADFEADWLLAQSMVPEPTLLSLAAGGLLVGASRRRMRSTLEGVTR